MIDVKLGDVARVCHEANRAWQFVAGHDISPPWDEISRPERSVVIGGVMKVIDGVTPEELHDRWCESKLNLGWTYGEVKNDEAKTHPSLVPYSQLSAEDKRKDILFRAIVNAFMEEL